MMQIIMMMVKMILIYNIFTQNTSKGDIDDSDEEGADVCIFRYNYSFVIGVQRA